MKQWMTELIDNLEVEDEQYTIFYDINPNGIRGNRKLVQSIKSYGGNCTDILTHWSSDYCVVEYRFILVSDLEPTSIFKLCKKYKCSALFITKQEHGFLVEEMDKKIEKDEPPLGYSLDCIYVVEPPRPSYFRTKEIYFPLYKKEDKII